MWEILLCGSRASSTPYIVEVIEPKLPKKTVASMIITVVEGAFALLLAVLYL